MWQPPAVTACFCCCTCCAYVPTLMIIITCKYRFNTQALISGEVTPRSARGFRPNAVNICRLVTWPGAAERGACTHAQWQGSCSQTPAQHRNATIHVQAWLWRQAEASAAHCSREHRLHPSVHHPGFCYSCLPSDPTHRRSPFPLWTCCW